jgi:hypothetical protein
MGTKIICIVLFVSLLSTGYLCYAQELEMEETGTSTEKITEIDGNISEEIKTLYRTLELLIIEHNRKGKEYRQGEITEEQFRSYQKKEIEPKVKKVLYLRNKLIEGVPIDKVEELKAEGRFNISYDSKIDINTIEKIGNGKEIIDPIEDFTEYTEEDPNTRITVDLNTITFTGIDRQETAYVYKDKGIDHFNEDFEILFEAQVGVITSYGIVGTVYLANMVGTDKQIDNANESAIGHRLVHNNGVAGYRHQLIEWDAGTFYSDIGTIAQNTTYYHKFVRDESVGANGTAYDYIYSDSDMTNLVDTLSVALHTAKRDFRYIYGLIGLGDSVNSYKITGFIEDLDLQEEIPDTEPEITNIMLLYGIAAIMGLSVIGLLKETGNKWTTQLR